MALVKKVPRLELEALGVQAFDGEALQSLTRMDQTLSLPALTCWGSRTTEKCLELKTADFPILQALTWGLPQRYP